MFSTVDISLTKIPASAKLTFEIDKRLPQATSFIDITGQVRGRLKVLGFVGYQGRYSAWLVECTGCGDKSVVRVNQLSPSFVDRQNVCATCKFGDYTRAMWSYWCRLNHEGRLCREWSKSFLAFADSVGERPEGMVLYGPNRKKKIGPKNWEWEQFGRQLSTVRWYEIDGEKLPMTAWAERVGVTRERMRQRFNKYEAGEITLKECLTPKGQACESSLSRIENPDKWRKNYRKAMKTKGKQT